MRTPTLHPGTFLDEGPQEWEQLLTRLPADLADTARRYGALRRCRGVPSAAALLRLIWAYATGPSLEAVALWARDTGVAQLSQEALDKRLRGATAWLAYLVGQVLGAAALASPQATPWRLRVLDATTVQRPGTTQPDRRLHVGLDLATGRVDHLAVTDARVGERLADFPTEPGDLLIVDRGYASRAGLVAVRARGGDVLGRLPWKGVPLARPDGTRLALLATCRTVSPGTTAALAVCTVATRHLPAVAGQLIITALPPAEAAQARTQAQRRARHSSKRRGAATWEAAGYVILFTTLAPDALSPAQACALYRLRWQIEIAFKRLKQVYGFHDVRAQTDALCETVILAKLLLALLVEQVLAPLTAAPPPSPERPLNPCV
jgi:hypothetical protein